MAGSNGFVRTTSFAGSEETEVTDRPVHFTIVYRKDGTITAYRDGQLYGKSYKTGFQKYSAGAANLLFGLRHMTPAGNKFLAGRILQAELFDRPLNNEEVAAIAGDPKNYVPEKEILAFLSEQANVDGIRNRRVYRSAQWPELSASEPPSNWRDSWI